jgi:hypothetical protein
MRSKRSRPGNRDRAVLINRDVIETARYYAFASPPISLRSQIAPRMQSQRKVGPGGRAITGSAIPRANQNVAPVSRIAPVNSVCCTKVRQAARWGAWEGHAVMFPWNCGARYRHGGGFPCCSVAYIMISSPLENRTGADPFPSTPARFTAILNSVGLNSNQN